MESPPSPTIPKIRATLLAQRRIILGLVQNPEIAFLVIIIALTGIGAVFDAAAFRHLLHMVDRVLRIIGDDLRRIALVVAAAVRDIFQLRPGLRLRLIGDFLGLRIVALRLVDTGLIALWFLGHKVLFLLSRQRMAARFVPPGIAPPPGLRGLYLRILIYPYYYAAQVGGLSLSTAPHKRCRSGTDAFAERAVPMSKFPSLPANPEMIEVFATHSEGFESLCDYHDTILRGPSPLSIAERELIATYVSGLNQCDFCYDSHRGFAEVHGVAPESFELLVSDPAAAGIDERLLPLLAYARKLTQAPSSVSDSDAANVYAAGWSEKALFHTIAVTGIFNLMNRLVEGTGITADPLRRNASRDRMANEIDNPRPYAGFAQMIVNASEGGILGDSMTGGGWDDGALTAPSDPPIA